MEEKDALCYFALINWMEFLRTQRLAINGKADVIAQKEATFKELLFRTVQSRGTFAVDAKALKLFIDSECGKARESIPADIKAARDDALFRSLRWGFFRKQDLRPLFVREALHTADALGAGQDAVKTDAALWQSLGLKEKERGSLFAAAENTAAVKDERVKATFVDMDVFTAGREKYVSSPVLNICICATMSAGKSTFVNALLGRDVLPSRNEATTARVTSVYDDDSQRGAVGFTIGDSLAGEKLLSISGNADGALLDKWNADAKVERIWLQSDLDNIASNNAICAVHDTPGTNNSQDNGHHDVTMKFLKENKMNMIVFVANATQPMTTDEMTLLKELLREVVSANNTPVLFVLNKADSIDSEKESLPDLIARYKKYIADLGFKAYYVLPASSKAARLLKMAVGGRAGEFTEATRDEFPTVFRKFLKRANFSSEEASTPASGEGESIEIDGEKYAVTELREALRRTGIGAIEDSISDMLGTVQSKRGKFCPHCGAKLDGAYAFCPVCGKPLSSNGAVQAASAPAANAPAASAASANGAAVSGSVSAASSGEVATGGEAEANISPKSRMVALLLCFFLCGFGVHRFYVGKKWSALLRLASAVSLISGSDVAYAIFLFVSLLNLIDLIAILIGKFKDKQGRRLKSWSGVKA